MSNRLKILIILMYFDRPTLVRNALYSILLANKYYDNWVLGFNDDGSTVPGEPIVKEILSSHLDKVKFYRLNATQVEKIKSGGTMGESINRIIKETEADLGIMLCDDDALHPLYLRNLNIYFQARPKVLSCYSHVISYNPLIESFLDAIRKNYAPDPTNPLNYYNKPLFCANKVDASQVAWRITCNKNFNVWFPSPLSKCHDRHFYQSLNKNCGKSKFSGFISQFKGLHTAQLIRNTYQWSVNNMANINTNYFLSGIPIEGSCFYETVERGIDPKVVVKFI